jgi:hypothetical protein
LFAAPIPRDQLQVTSVINTADALFGANSNYNPRHFNGNNFAVQINNTSGVVRQPAGGEEPDATLWLTGEPEARMVSPFDGGKSTDWLLLGGGANEPQFSRVPLNAEDAADREHAGPDDHEPNSFDWVDDDTIIYASYEFRDSLYLADVVAEPFSVTPNPLWNPAGSVKTQAGRIRNVRVGDVYSGFAYYAESAVASDARVFAIDLQTGVSSVVTTIDDVSGDGSWGLWTVKESDGYLYVQTSHDGVYVYEMQSATTTGSLATHYTKEDIDNLMLEAGGTITPNWGFEVANRGSLMLFGGSGTVIEVSVPFVELEGDFNRNGVLDAADLDLMADARLSGSYSAELDLDGDGFIGVDDRSIWLRDLKNTWVGDSDLNGVFDSADFVAVFQAGQYEDAIAGNSTWATGDWDGDKEFTSSDFVFAFVDGGYEQGPRAAVAAVPEPSSWLLALFGLFVIAPIKNFSNRCNGST